MTSFYQYSADGKSASVALHQAMKSLRDSEKFSAIKFGLHLYSLVTTSLLILEKNDNRIVSITLFDSFLDTHYVLSLDLIRRQSTCEVAAGTAWDTTPTHEVIVPPATRNIAGLSSPPACLRS